MSDNQAIFLAKLPEKFKTSEALEVTESMMLSRAFCLKTLRKLTLTGFLLKAEQGLYYKLNIN
jgi:hypothetical protein